MTQRQRIDALREARLWAGQIVIPAVTAAAMIMSNPQAREYVEVKMNNAKNRIKSVFNK